METFILLNKAQDRSLAPVWGGLGVETIKEACASLRLFLFFFLLRVTCSAKLLFNAV